MGEGGKAAFAKGAKKKGGAKSGTKKAGLTFPVPRVGRYMKNGRYADRVNKKAPIFMTAVLEYVVAELLELAGNAARAEKKGRIRPRHVQLAISDDDELKALFGHVTIKDGGVAPGIHEFLNKAKPETKKQKEKKDKKAAKKAKKAATERSNEVALGDLEDNDSVTGMEPPETHNPDLDFSDHDGEL
eukprot:gene1090-1027_t